MAFMLFLVIGTLILTVGGCAAVDRWEPARKRGGK